MVYCRECGCKIEQTKKGLHMNLCRICQFDEYEDDIVTKLAAGNFEQENYSPDREVELLPERFWE